MSALQVLERIRDEVNAFISGMTEKAEKTEALTAEVVETEKTEAEVVENALMEVAAEAPAAKGTVPSNGQAKSRKNGGVNKSELIRNYFEKHGMGSRNKDLIYAIRKSKDVELNPTLVSIIRKNIESNRVSKTRAQKAPKKVAKKAVKARVGRSQYRPSVTGTHRPETHPTVTIRPARRGPRDNAAACRGTRVPGRKGLAPWQATVRPVR